MSTPAMSYDVENPIQEIQINYNIKIAITFKVMLDILEKSG